MKARSTLILAAVFSLGLCWWVATLLIDVMAVPTVFQVLSGVEKGVEIGGRIGLLLFGKFNYVEILLAASMAGLLYARRTPERNLGVVLFLLGVIPWIYTLSLGPAIAYNFQIIADPASTSEAIQKAQERHSLLHHSYIAIDVAKLVLLGIFLVGVARRGVAEARELEAQTGVSP